MQNVFRRIMVCIDFATGKPVRPDGAAPENRCELILDETVIFCLKVVDRVPEPGGGWTLVPHVLPDSAVFAAVAGEEFFREGSALFEADFGAFNLPGDWEEERSASLAAGELSVRIRTGTDRFREAAMRCGNSGQLAITLEDGGGNKRVLARIAFSLAFRATDLNGVDVLPIRFCRTIDYSPVINRLHYHEDYDVVGYLDQQNALTFAGYHVRPIETIRLYLVSANTAVTGLIAVAAMVNDVQVETFQLGVGAVPTAADLVFNDPVSGRIRLECRSGLSEGQEIVTALVIRAEVHYAG